MLPCLSGVPHLHVNRPLVSIRLSTYTVYRPQLLKRWIVLSHGHPRRPRGRLVGTRESLNGRKSIHGTKKSKERREEPLGTMSYQTSSKRSPPFWLLTGARKKQAFWHQSEARTAATVWNWSGKTLSPGALLAVLYFSSFHVYFPPV